ncbi:hypothetical protein [Pseudoxanthomonas sp. CF125]|uniref:hypothetical protein n=1 Tax=Pseudoxanthomonas sp. CF125 TaxID=1855303 RepID=UPI000881199B|nr:hypothetical protein [Pseudoxanthomonas sp. CF125]SDQ24568.1 hypothetical protein SAMN05216569_0271 [Pseudoxanthomonas sp. CF125]
MKNSSTKFKTHGSIKWTGVLCFVGLGALVASVPCFAQSSLQGVDLRYDTLLKRQDRNNITAGNQFGEQHSLESGSLSFNVVDVDLVGNDDLAVEFRRTLVATDSKKQLSGSTFTYPATRLGDWAIGLPKIQGTFDALVGWISGDASRPTKNCSIATSYQIEPPPSSQYPETFRAHMFWNPPTVQYPDGSSGLLLYNSGLMPVPSTGGPYFWITSSQDVASCIAVLKNKNDASPLAEERIFGQGEGYLIIRPDGNKYWFDWIALESNLPSKSTQLIPCGGSPYGCDYQADEVVLQQATLALYPTRIEDRFGNWVAYSYSNKSNEMVKLDKIQSSDGRVIDIGYIDGRISTVTANGRTWSYIYAEPTTTVPVQVLINLSEVRNPDSSSWRYSGDSHPYPPARRGDLQLSIFGPCYDLTWTQHVNPDATAVGDTDFTGYTVEAPSGARAVFRVDGVMLGRSGVPESCYQTGAYLPSTTRPSTAPRYFLGDYQLALTGKKITGSGLLPAIWKYHYQSDIGFAPMAAGSSRTKVLDPEGAFDNYTFGNTFGVDEGLLLAHTRTANQQTSLNETNVYAVGTSTPGFPKLIGYHPDANNRYAQAFMRPKLSSTKIVQSTLFKWAVNNNCSDTGAAPCLDSLARPTSVTRSSSPAP